MAQKFAIVKSKNGKIQIAGFPSIYLTKLAKNYLQKTKNPQKNTQILLWVVVSLSTDF
jgi:ribosomal protein S17E